MKEGKTPSCHMSGNSERQITPAQFHNHQNHNMHTVSKIAAPKPLRARPITLTHMTANSKWLETSPIKSESTDLFGLDQDGIN